MAIRKFVLLVAGHGGGDPGATGQGTTEAQETIQITDRVYNLLASHPDILVERVPHELDFVDSTSWANTHYKNLTDGIVVEIHKNSAAVRASGNEVLIPTGSDAISKSFASRILDEITVTTGLPNRGVKERSDLYLIREVNMYACLVECGFIGTDPVDATADQKWAVGIANGLCDFFGVARPSTGSPKPVITTKEETKTEAVAFAKETQPTDKLPLGTTQLVRKGIDGVKTIVYKVTYTDGKETNRSILSETITTQPVSEITSVGTYVPPTKDQEQDSRLAELEAIVKSIVDFLKSIFTGFKK